MAVVSREQQLEQAQEYYDMLESHAADKDPNWAELSVGDPVRILLESVAEFATDLHMRVRPESDRLFETIPEYLGLPNPPVRAVSGFVTAMVESETPIALPKGTLMHGYEADSSRRFSSLSDVTLLPISLGDEFVQNGWYHVAIEGETLNSFFHLVLWRLYSAKHDTPLVIQYRNGERWVNLDDSTFQGTLAEHGFHQLMPSYKHQPLERCDYRGATAVWLRIRLDDVREGELSVTASQKRISALPGDRQFQIFLNSIPVVENQVESECTLGHVLGVAWQQISLPLQPSSPEFAIHIEGDRHPWSPVASWKKAKRNERVFLYDDRHNTVIFGDGRNGRMPSPVGAAMMVRDFEHRGGQLELAAGSIQELDTAVDGVQRLEQPFPFFSTRSSARHAKALERFTDTLWDQRCVSSPLDFVRRARLRMPQLEHIKAIASRELIPNIKLVLYGDAIRTNDSSLNYELMNQLQRELNEQAGVGIQVSVLPAQPRQLRLELGLLLTPQHNLDSFVEKLGRTLLPSLIQLKQVEGPLHLQRIDKLTLRELITAMPELSRLDRINLIDEQYESHHDSVELDDDEYPQFSLSINASVKNTRSAGGFVQA